MILKIECEKHPKYKAERRPTADCDVCRLMWTLRYDFIKFYFRGGVSVTHIEHKETSTAVFVRH
jgi:hypothetical protein